MLDGQYNPFEQSGHLKPQLLPSTYSRKTNIIFGNEKNGATWAILMMNLQSLIFYGEDK
jgi:hypothetical protein